MITAAKNEARNRGAAALRSYWWPILAAALLAVQALVAAAVKSGASVSVYSNFVYFLVLLLATGIATLNAVRSGQTIRLFWFFLALGCGLQALSSWTWTYYVAILGERHPGFLVSAIPLYLHTVFLIAAVASRPHLKLAHDKPYRTTLNLLLLLFFFAFAYTIVLLPISLTQYSEQVLHAQVLYSAENLLLLAVLGAAVIAARPPWKMVYWHLLGASTLYALGSLAANLAIASGRMSAGWYTLLYTAGACWFIWVALQGRELAPQLEQTVQVDTINPKYVSTLAMLAVVAIPIVGVWELFRSDRPYATHVIRLLIVFLALLLLAVTAFIMEYFTKRELSSDAGIAHDRLQMAMASAKSVGWEWDLASGQDRWFGDLQSMFGISSDTFSCQVADFFRYVHPDDRKRVSEAITDARVNHKPYEAEFRVVRQDGTIRWASARGAFYYAKDGHPERMLGMAVDITDRKLAEEAREKSEEKFSKAFRESPMALTLTSALDHRYVDVNETFEQLTGWQRDEVIGRTPYHLQLWASPAQRVEFLRRLQAEGSVRNFEVRYRRKDGTERVGLGSGELIEIANEPCVLSVIADITDRKQIEERLRESEERLRGIVDSAMDAIIAVDEEQRIFLFNPAAETMFGCSVKDALGTAIDRFIPERFRKDHAARIRGFKDSGVTSRSMDGLKTLRAVRMNGEEFPIEASISRTDTEGKKLFTVIIRDMSERYRREEAQRESEERLHLAVQAGKMYAYEWDPATDTITRSPECLDILGSSQPLEISRREMLAQVHPDDRELVDASFTGITRDNPTSQVSYRFLRSDGSVIWLEKRARAFFDDKGTLLQTVGVSMDITDRKLGEEALASLGRKLIEAHEEERTWIARELHDDVNQRLALLAIELDQWKQHGPETRADISVHVQHAQQRLLDISRDVQALSHRLHSSKLEYLGLAGAANSYCKEFCEQYNVKVEFSHSDIPRGLPGEVSLVLFRVLQEALQNALKHSHVKDFKVDLRAAPGEISLTVTDMGKGFDQREAMNRRGLGIISMRERLQLVNGSFTIESEPGCGTIVRARVPIKSEADRLSMAG